MRLCTRRVIIVTVSTITLLFCAWNYHQKRWHFSEFVWKETFNSTRKYLCDQSLCLNGTTCGSRADCFCKPGFIGRKCEDEMDERHSERESLWIKIAEESKTKRRKRRLPDVIGIGVEKCGTDALHSFLRHHPMIKVSIDPETHFFTGKYGKGIAFYKNMMPEVADDEVLMEKTPAYFNFYPSETPFRIRKWLPEVKLLLILCDPVNRSYSDFVHEKVIGKISNEDTFDHFMNVSLKKYRDILTQYIQKPDSRAYSFITRSHYETDELSHILTTGLYYYHLLRWKSAFGIERLYIIDGEHLVSNAGEEIEKVQEYLGLPKLLLKEDFIKDGDTGFFCFAPKWSQKMKLRMGHETKCLAKSKGRTRKKPRVASDEMIASLEEFYKPFNEKLFQLLHRKMSWV